MSETRPEGLDELRNSATVEAPSVGPTSAKVDVRDNETALALCGNQNENLKLMERRLGVRVGQRGTELHLSGPSDAVAFAVRLVENLEEMIRAGRSVYREDVEQGIKVLGRGGAESLGEVMLGP